MRLAIKNQYTSNQAKQLQANYAIVPGNVFNENTHIGATSNGRSQSLSIWRKGMFSSNKTNPTKSSKTKISDYLKPNGYIVKTINPNVCDKEFQASVVITSHPINQSAQSGSCFYDASKNTYFGCNPEVMVTKPANTSIDKHFHQTNQSFLKSRCYTTQQHQFYNKIHDNQYTDAKGVALPFTESATSGPQVFQVTPCAHTNQNNKGCNKTTVKLRNQSFQTNNAVSSGARTAKLQHDTLTRENNLFRSSHGITMNSNYIPGGYSKYTNKSKNDRNCNATHLALMKLRHAKRSNEYHAVECCNSCPR